MLNEWCEGGLGNRRMTLEAVRQCAKIGKRGAYVTDHEAIFAWPGVLSDRPAVLRWLSPGKGWDAIT